VARVPLLWGRREGRFPQRATGGIVRLKKADYVSKRGGRDTALRLLSSTERENGSRIRVVVVDDHPLLRDAVRLACEGDERLEVVGEAASGPGALEACAEHRPDVLVLDIGLPGIDGVEVVRRLKASESPTRILILTGSEDPSALFEARRAGVDGFMEKDGAIGEVPRNIAAVHDGTWDFSALQQQMSNLQLHRLVSSARERSRVASSLTPRELNVLRLLAEGSTNRQAAVRLGLSQRTVESHIAKLYRKLGVGTRVQAVVQATRLGILRSGEGLEEGAAAVRK
jgi:DNA-binding NarL/FixJ family response regulator